MKSEANESARKPKPQPSSDSAAEPSDVPEEDAEFLLFALFSGKPWRSTEFSVIAEDCPTVWQKAMEIFETPDAARNWLEMRSPAFDSKCPYAVALQAGGEHKVLQELDRLFPAKFEQCREAKKGSES